MINNARHRPCHVIRGLSLDPNRKLVRGNVPWYRNLPCLHAEARLPAFGCAGKVQIRRATWLAGQARYRDMCLFSLQPSLTGCNLARLDAERARQSAANKACLLRISQLRGTRVIAIHPCTLSRSHLCPVSLIQDTMAPAAAQLRAITVCTHYLQRLARKSNRAKCQLGVI